MSITVSFIMLLNIIVLKAIRLVTLDWMTILHIGIWWVIYTLVMIAYDSVRIRYKRKFNKNV